MLPSSGEPLRILDHRSKTIRALPFKEDIRSCFNGPDEHKEPGALGLRRKGQLYQEVKDLMERVPDLD